MLCLRDLESDGLADASLTPERRLLRPAELLLSLRAIGRSWIMLVALVGMIECDTPPNMAVFPSSPYDVPS